MEKYPCEGTTVLLINTTVTMMSLQDPKDVGQKKKDCRKEKYKELFGGCPRKLMEVFPILDNVGSYHDIFGYCSLLRANSLILRIMLQSLHCAKRPLSSVEYR